MSTRIFNSSRSRGVFKKKARTRTLAIGVLASFGIALVLQNAVLTPTLAAEESTCDGFSEPAPVNPMQVNLVIDDSGSMFYDRGKILDRWSFAKYSLQVFAALLRPDDTLKVFLLSDFVPDGNRLPALQLKGSDSIETRVEEIANLQFKGKRTPYAAVQEGFQDLNVAEGVDRWLVVVTDGKFKADNKQDIETSQVEADLAGYVEKSQDSQNPIKVAFLALGNEAPEIKADPDKGIYFAKAVTSEDLLNQLTGFSNRIFGRAVHKLDLSGVWAPDMAMSEVLVFAQGEGVEVGDAHTSKGPNVPSSAVKVSWTPNQDIEYKGKRIIPTPNQELEGQIATFADIPAGKVKFDISSYKTVSLFYKPDVNFGINLLDESGEKVIGNDIISGEYTLKYGFMDENCELIGKSDLLGGEVKYGATMVQDGVQSSVKSGQKIDFSKGPVSLNVTRSPIRDDKLLIELIHRDISV